MKLETFRRRFPVKTIRAAGQPWGMIETKGKPGAPTLVMLPGTLGTAEIFWNQIVSLGKSIRVVSVTYPPVGNIVKLADGLAALFDKLKIAKASVVGSSMGGYLGQWFAARHADRVETLYIGNSLIGPEYVNPARKPPAVLRRLPPKAHQAIVIGSIDTWPEPEPIFVTLKDVLRHSGRKLISGKALKQRVLATTTGKEVPPPVLPPARTIIIDCVDDPLIPHTAQKAMRKKYPRAKLYRLSRGGHYPYITRPERYTRILSRHLPR